MRHHRGLALAELGQRGFGLGARHVARTVTRRAERLVVELVLTEPGVNSEVMVYLNRLSDLLFVFARMAGIAPAPSRRSIEMVSIDCAAQPKNGMSISSRLAI